MNGQFDESDHIKNTCIPKPANCPAEICGCTPGEFLSCDSNGALRCGADGMSTTSESCAKGCDVMLGGCRCAQGESKCENGAVEVCQANGAFSSPQACALGCSATGIRCVDVSASNGLNAALDTAGQRLDYTVTAGGSFDTSTGVVLDGSGNSVAIPSVLVTQVGGSPIRVFLVHSITIHSSTVKGTNAFAIVADDTIDVRGALDVGGHGATAGPGATTSTSCSGENGTVYSEGTFSQGASGAGGAGHATQGARGGNQNGQSGGIGGAIFGDDTGVPLVGGCGGGFTPPATNATGGTPGRGGGAMQLVARRRIQIATTGADVGQLSVAGGGGVYRSGGGSGGTALLEAPVVLVDGSGAGVFANGGGGASCEAGQDGLFGPTAAVGGNCAANLKPYNQAGAGATGTSDPQPGGDYCPPTPAGEICKQGGYGPGGGGGLGILRVNTATGSFAASNGAIVSAHSSAGKIGTR